MPSGCRRSSAPRWRDFGYDVADYCDVDPLFGTLADFDRLIAEAHAPRHPGHARLRAEPHVRPASVVPRRPLAADEPEARLVRLARPGSPTARRPTTGSALFGGPAWTLGRGDEPVYYHAFLPEQPDLNWRNPAVRDGDVRRAALLARRAGVDGFRIDVLSHDRKDAGCAITRRTRLRAGRLGPERRRCPRLHGDRPGGAGAPSRDARRRRRVPRAAALGEVYVPLERLVALLRRRRARRPHAVQLRALATPWDARTIGAAVAAYEAALPPDAWPN